MKVIEMLALILLVSIDLIMTIPQPPHHTTVRPSSGATNNPANGGSGGGSTTLLPLCIANATCAWHTYAATATERTPTHIVQYCECPPNTVCSRYREEIAIKSWRYRCTTNIT